MYLKINKDTLLRIDNIGKITKDQRKIYFVNLNNVCMHVEEYEDKYHVNCAYRRIMEGIENGEFYDASDKDRYRVRNIDRDDWSDE